MDNDSPQEEVKNMSVTAENVSKKMSPLENLRQRAEIRRNRNDLKHFSSKENADAFNKDFSEMEQEINRTIK